MENLTGQTFGRLTVIEHVGFTKNRNAKWKVMCSCGNEKIISAGNLKAGTISCGCYFREQAGSYKQLPNGIAALNSLYSTYKSKASRRGLVFELDILTFKRLTQQFCYYCGVKPHKVHKVNKRSGEYVFNGIDREDNTKGYTIENSIPCCYICNRMKHAMDAREFKAHIERIYEWQKNMHLDS